MKILHYSTQFKKDYKRYRNQTKKIEKLFEVLRLIASEEKLPDSMQAHTLSWQFKECLELPYRGRFLADMV
jgi:mRNA interferase YafQ